MWKQALGILVLAGLSAVAQSDRGSITGNVTDRTSAPIPGASVSALNTSTGVNYPTTTNETGNYFIPQLPAGIYELTVTAPGFRQLVRRNIVVNVAQTVTLNVGLEVGQVEQSIEVTSAPPVVESTTSELGTVVSSRSVIDLPLAVSGNMRNPEAFIFLTPGVTGDATNTQINGSPSRAKEILLDGASASNPESGGVLFTYPSVEAIGEFKLLSSNFSAEYGRTGGGFEIFTTRSGTNELHGAIFDYFRNDALDARGFFSRTTPVNRQNEFGARIGGPVLLPRLYDGRNRTFFHLVYSGFRYKAGATNELLSIPNEAFRRGDFSGLVDRNGNQIPIYDPATTRFVNGEFTRIQFPGNIIPQSRFSEVARRYIAELPPTTNGAILNNFLAVGARTFDRDQVNVKIDHAFTERNRLSGFLYTGTQTILEPERIPVPFSNALDEKRYSHWARLNHDYIVSPTTLNHLILAYTREVQDWSKFGADEGWPERLGLTGVNTGAGNTPPRITFGDGFTTWGDNVKSVGLQANNVWQITNNLSHVRGKHTLKFGGDYRWMETNGADFAYTQGVLDFRAIETAFPTAAGRASSGNSFASFLVGAVDAAQLKILEVVPSNRYQYLAFYAQDDWKISQRLTLNLGLRYEVYFPRTERFGNLSGFNPDLPNPAAGGRLGAIEFLGDGPGRSGRSSFADTWYGGFGPRVGFAYSVTPLTVLRGGYGVSYAPGNAAAGLRASQRFGFGFNAQPTWQTTNSGVDPAFQLDAGFPQNFARPPFIDPSVANGSDVDYMEPGDGRVPYFQNFTFGVQQELPSSILAEVAYVGVKGTRLGTNLINVNQVHPQYLGLGSLLNRPVSSPEAQAAGIAVPYPGFSGTVAQALRPYPQYNNIISRSNPNGNSTYHALQAKAEKRFSRGLSFLGAYTWSKTISDADILAGLGPGGQTYYNRGLEKAISTNDVPHIFAFSYVYELPFGPGKPFLNGGGLSGKLFGGWTFTGIHQYSAGKPVVLSATNTMPLFAGLLRPDVVSGVERALDHENFDPAVDRWINPDAFVPPGGMRFGTAARSYTDLRAPWYFNENIGLIKRTNLTESVLLTFRLEFFNVFNRVVFAAPEGNVNSGAFGRVSRQANDPRQGQLALRLEF
jgi:outer membrane receptor protein involved in Fe transport